MNVRTFLDTATDRAKDVALAPADRYDAALRDFRRDVADALADMLTHEAGRLHADRKAEGVLFDLAEDARTAARNP